MSFEDYMWGNYKYLPDELEITDTPGVWRVKAGCPGGKDCKHTARIAGITCNGDTPLTVSYFEHSARDERGRFVSPYRVWERQRALRDDNAPGAAGEG